MKRFPSIKKNEDFRLVYGKGRSYAGSCLIMYVMENGKDLSRIGISASKKIGNSVIRHTMARLVRESFRLSLPRLKKGYDIVVVVRKNAVRLRFDGINLAFTDLAKRHNIL